MHFKSNQTDGFTVYAVAGTNTVSFAIDFSDQAVQGLLGFAVERHDHKDNERYYMYGFKVFKSVIADPQPGLVVSTFDQPVQSFVWDDFTAKPDRRYDYYFHPLRGRPKLLERGAPIRIGVTTEPLFSSEAHDVFFNRGAASSQAFSRRFGGIDLMKDNPPDPRRSEALDWLGRDLDNAIYAFIDAAGQGDTLLGCFYEFHYAPVLERLKQAASQRGVAVKLILDGKDNSYTDKDGKFHEAFPREVNRAAVTQTGLDANVALWRQNNQDNIQHNKFIVLMRGAAETPAEVWTGSTNISEGGIYGQTNVGHWIRDAGVAGRYRDYWELLLTDPGSSPDDDRSTATQARKDYRNKVMALVDVPSATSAIAVGITPVFSPRAGSEVLDMYVDILDEAKKFGGVTLAFGINKAFKAALADNTSQNAVTFMLLENRDKPRANSKDPFVPLTARQNVYEAWGSYMKDPLYQWVKETNTRKLGLNSHVAYVHSKFMLQDPLSDAPIVITGSANFSDASTNDNDENMVIIRGPSRAVSRAADIYFTEFNRLFNHYYFRSVTEAHTTGQQFTANGAADNTGSLFLAEDDSWLSKYTPGKLRRKRLDIFLAMDKPQIL